MKVLYCIRKNYLERVGGDSTQLLNTIKYIKKIDDSFEYKIISDPSIISNHLNYDLMHIFNIQDYDFLKEFMVAAKENNMRVVLSTIYWDMSECLFVERMFKLVRNFHIVSMFHPLKKMVNLNTLQKMYMGKAYKKKYHDVLDNVDLFLPNSEEEWDIIQNYFDIKNRKAEIIPNAIENLDYSTEENKEMEIEPRNSILVVGRIEPTKNQLAVLLACKDNSIPILFVGDFSSKKYEKIVRFWAKKRGNVIFCGKLSQNEVYKYYRKAKVHVLASFRESPGLVTLEALRAGCNIVVSDKQYCPIKYYQFDKYAFVCNPYSIRSIKNSIKAAYNSPMVTVSEDYFEFYSYKNAARLTLEAYKKITRIIP